MHSHAISSSCAATACSGHESACCHDHKQPLEPINPRILERSSDTRAVFRIPAMDCPMEEALIRKKLAPMPGVRDLKFNLMNRTLVVDHEPGKQEAIKNALIDIGMTPEQVEEKAPIQIQQAQIPWRKLIIAIILAAFAELTDLLAEWHTPLAGMESIRIGFWPLSTWIAFVASMLAIYIGGLGTFKKGWIAVRNFNLNINALMAVAVTGAILIGQFPEAAMVMVLFNISEAIEAMALDKARQAIKSLMELSPEKATVRMPDGSWVEQEVSAVPVGAIIRARPGEKIALDGIVTAGHSYINQAPITGESIPVEKQPGDVVYSGALNESGSLEYRATAAANDSTLARIIHTVQEAQATRAPMQRFIDVFAKYYTPCIFGIAVLWAIFMPVIFQMPWLNAFYTALVLLVIGCPCALVISTPVTIVSAMAAATANGVLIKGGLYLEQARKMNLLALDKTGTITSGNPKLTESVACSELPLEKCEYIAASLAARSDHPVSRALAESKMNGQLAEVSDFAALPGMGIEGLIDNKKWALGNIKLIAKFGHAESGLADRIRQLEEKGQTVVALIGENGVAAIFAVADALRETSVQAIRKLTELGISTMLLTGDNEATAKAIAAEAGISKFRANLLPQDKLEIITELKESGHVTGMVGDGINDAPALAKANISYAMAGSGTDTAIETADIAIMDDDLCKIPALVRLSHASKTILMENISFALLIKAFFFIITLAGLATMWMAIFADVGAALLVTANGLRAKYKFPKIK